VDGNVLPEYARDALELARENPAYEKCCQQISRTTLCISAHAMNDRGGEGVELWDKEDGFYYERAALPNGERHYLKVRSLVGLIPLLRGGDAGAGHRRQTSRFQAAHCQCSSTIIRMSQITSKWRR